MEEPLLKDDGKLACTTCKGAGTLVLSFKTGKPEMECFDCRGTGLRVRELEEDLIEERDRHKKPVQIVRF